VYSSKLEPRIFTTELLKYINLNLDIIFCIKKAFYTIIFEILTLKLSLRTLA